MTHMISLRSKITGFLAANSGATAIEYVIMGCVMGLMLIPTAAMLAGKLETSYYNVLLELF